MTCDIFYFSGTGNSLHAAKEIRKRIPDSTLHPIISLLDEDRIRPSASMIGIVFPVYTNSVPYQVREFLKKLELSTQDYIFSVVTHGGVVNIAFTRIYLNKALKKKGKDLSCFWDIEMIINTPIGIIPSFIPVNKKWPEQISKERIEKMERNIGDEFDRIAASVLAREVNVGKERLKDEIIERLFSRISGGTGREIDFLSDETCTSCELCQRICLSGKIRMKDGRPHWQRDVNCFYCYACFNYCPTRSILVKRWQRKDGRYHHPEVSADEIAGQKAASAKARSGKQNH